jgi:DNA-binding NarL/FixJ family response regulator
VVVAEDSPIVRERLVRLLIAFGNVNVVGEATTAAEAVEKIIRLAPDFVTLDLRLEGSSGLDVLRALQKHPSRPRIAVLTNYHDSPSRRECLALGADFYFDKSLEVGHLKTMLGLVAASRPSGVHEGDAKTD